MSWLASRSPDRYRSTTHECAALQRDCLTSVRWIENPFCEILGRYGDYDNDEDYHYNVNNLEWVWVGVAGGIVRSPDCGTMISELNRIKIRPYLQRYDGRI